MSGLPDTSAPSGLAVADLTVSYGGNVAVEGVSFSAPVGIITGLIGPNGAGKTTTFNVCSGLLRPVSGSVTRTETPGRGKPTAPGTRSPSYGFDVFMLVSVMP